MWAELLKPILEIISAVLKIKAADAYYDLTKKIESDIEAMEAERDKLRTRGNPGDERRADILQGRILRNAGIASRIPEPLPAAGAAVEGGTANPDA